MLSESAVAYRIRHHAIKPLQRAYPDESDQVTKACMSRNPSPLNVAPSRSPSTISESVLWVLFGLMGLAVFYRLVLASGFDFIPGYGADGQLVLGLSEHWWQVYTGNARWLHLPMFYPSEGVLGWSDSLWIYGLIYSGYRLLGLDLFEAQFALLFSLGAIGYAGMGVLLRRGLGLPFFASCAGAFSIFLWSPIYTTMQNTHLQLLAVWLTPWIVFWGLRMFQQRHARPLTFYPPAVAFALGLPLLCFTSFYIGWFLILFAGLAVLWAGALAARTIDKADEASELHPPSPCRLRDRALQSIKLGAQYMKGTGPRFLLVAILFAGAMVPFFLTYLPALATFDGYSAGQILPTLPDPGELLNVGKRNYVWGSLINEIPYLAESGGEKRLGIPPLTLALFFFCTAYLLGKCRSPHRNKHLLPVAAVGVAVCTCWILLLRMGNISLWSFVIEWVPGAQVIRIPFRFNVFLTVPMTLVMITAITTLASRSKERRGRTSLGAAGSTGMAAIALLFAAEHWDVGHNEGWFPALVSNLRPQLQQVEPPPPGATAFFLLPPPPYAPPAPYVMPAEFQATALRIANVVHVPTLNGLSGNFPPDWDLYDPHQPNYLFNVRNWIEAHNLHNVYALDLETGVWAPAEEVLPKRMRPQFDSNVIQHPIQVAGYFIRGWSDLEPNLIWSTSHLAAIFLPMPDENMTDLSLELVLVAFVNDQRPLQVTEISINGDPVARLELTPENTPLRLDIPVAPNWISDQELLRIELKNTDLMSPYQQGLSDDKRTLGVGVQSLRILNQSES